MGVEKSWLWNVKTTDAEARKILKDPENPRFYIYAAKRLATANLPREVFRDYLGREDFLKGWPAIKRQMRKDSRNHERVIFWQGVYEFLIRDLKLKGTPFVRPKVAVRVNPERKKAGEEMKNLRRARKMTQAELARSTGLTQQHIAKIEQGLTCPRFQTLRKIKKTLGAKPFEYPEEIPSPDRYRASDPGLQSASDLERRYPPASIHPPEITTWLDPDPGRMTRTR